MVEELLAARGITVSHETVRQWARKFGPEIATRLRRRAPRRGDKWRLDEVVLTIGGRKHYLWRAVDQDGFVLDLLVQSRRDTKAAKRCCATFFLAPKRPELPFRRTPGVTMPLPAVWASGSGCRRWRSA